MVGSSVSDPFTVEVAPAPINVKAIQVGSTSVTVSWTQSGTVTGYWIYYVSADGQDSGSVGPITGTSHTLDSLQSDQIYTIVVNSVGHKQLPSNRIGIVIGGIVYLKFYNQAISNNSYVQIGDISTDTMSMSTMDGLLCASDTTNPTTRQWYKPNENPVGTTPPIYGTYQANTGRGVVMYGRGSIDNDIAGMYHCIISDSLGTTHTLYAGLYTGSGNTATVSGRANDGPDISGYIQFYLKTAPNVDPPVFQLTCTSSTAPATSVQWSKDGSPVSGGSSSQIVTDTVEATYINELTVTGRQSGTYTCNIATLKAYKSLAVGAPTAASFTVNVPPTPTGVTAVQVDPTSVTVTWTQSGTVTGYWIYYASAGGGDSGTVGPITGTSHTLNNLQNDQTYTFRVIAVSHLPSNGAVYSIYLKTPPPSVSIQHTSMSIAGQQYKLTCTVVKAEGVHDVPTVQWMGPDGSVVVERDRNMLLDGPHTSGTTSTLTLTFNPLVPSHGGGYTCQAGFDRPGTYSQSKTILIVTSKAAFQVKVGPVEYCIYWSEQKAKKMKESIRNSLANYITESYCACNSVANSMHSGVFSCQNTSIAVVYKAIVFVNSTNCNCTASELVSLIGEWAESEGTVQVGDIQLRANKNCPSKISSLDDKECGPDDDAHSTCSLARSITCNLCGN